MPIGSIPAFSTSGQPGLTPKNIANLAFWVRADLGITLDGLGYVSNWADQSGSGDPLKNLSTDTSLSYTNAPYLTSESTLGGQPAVGTLVLTESAWKLKTGTWDVPLLNPMTAYFVFNFQNTANSSVSTSWLMNIVAAANSQPGLSIGNNITPGTYINFSEDAASFTAQGPISQSTAHTICIVYRQKPGTLANVEFIVYVDNLAPIFFQNSSPAVATALSDLFIGSDTTGDPTISGSGHTADALAIAEIIIYKGDHSLDNETRKLIMNTYLGNRYGFFNPANLNLTVWAQAPYSGAPWGGLGSANPLSTTNKLIVGNAPTIGTALNGFNTASFDGIANFLQTTSNTSATIVSNGWSYSALVFITGTLIPNDNHPWMRPSILDTTNSWFGISFSLSGATVYQYDNGGSNPKMITVDGVTESTWLAVQVRWTGKGGNLEIRINGGPWAVNSAPSVLSDNSKAFIGQSNDADGAVFFQGLIADVMISPVSFDNATFDNIKSYYNSRYALSL